MRILVANVNTTESMTDSIGRQAVAAAAPGTEIVPLTPVFGAESVEGNYESYLAARSRAHPKAFRNLRARLRKVEDACLEADFRADDRDPQALAAVIGLKREQYRRTRQIDVFGPPWTGRLIEILAARTGPGLRGRLSTLRLDGRLAAGHFGLQADGVLHYWFTVYDEAFAAYSPGLLLLHRIAEAGAVEGISRIDLGGGDYRFKHEFADLRPPLLDEYGLGAALGWHAEEFVRRTRLRVDFEDRAKERTRTLRHEDAVTLFRIAQEALNNVAKHAQAERAWICLSISGRAFVLELRDDGRGFDPAAPTSRLGMRGMRERAEAAGAAFEVQSAPGRGTLVRVSMPLPE